MEQHSERGGGCSRDPDETGRARGIERSGARRGYADYREMLAKEKPDVVAIAPRWADRRFEMVKAAVDARAHILLEKPLARNLPEADAIVALAEGTKIRIQVGHAARFSLTMRHIRKLPDNL